MVNRDELLTLLRRRPFKPFRVALLDGRWFDIRFPENNIVDETFLAVGIPEPDEPDPFVDHVEVVGFDEIRGVEPSGLAESAAG